MKPNSSNKQGTTHLTDSTNKQYERTDEYVKGHCEAARFRIPGDEGRGRGRAAGPDGDDGGAGGGGCDAVPGPGSGSDWAG